MQIVLTNPASETILKETLLSSRNKTSTGILEHVCTIWSPIAPTTNIAKLQNIQNTATDCKLDSDINSNIIHKTAYYISTINTHNNTT